MGVRVVWGAEVRGFHFDAHERIVAVETSQGRLNAGRVVNAAGPWAGEVAKLAGVDLPVRPLRRQVAATVPTPVLPAAMPMTIFCADGFHLRVRDGRVLLLWATPGIEGAPFDARVEDAWIAEVVAKAQRRIPLLRDVPIDRAACWGGLYEMSPDRHAILGQSIGCENFFLINGSSGHGVMHAPALGHLLAEILLDGKTATLDASALRPSRFVEGKPNSFSELL
jgi:sarcosine oxidase subunit beta